VVAALAGGLIGPYSAGGCLAIIRGVMVCVSHILLVRPRTTPRMRRETSRPGRAITTSI